jgi:hypothetical protein
VLSRDSARSCSWWSGTLVEDDGPREALEAEPGALGATSTTYPPTVRHPQERDQRATCLLRARPRGRQERAHLARRSSRPIFRTEGESVASRCRSPCSTGPSHTMRRRRSSMGRVVHIVGRRSTAGDRISGVDVAHATAIDTVGMLPSRGPNVLDQHWWPIPGLRLGALALTARRR